MTIDKLRTAFAAGALTLLAAQAANAQQAADTPLAPAPGCTATSKQLEANKRLAMSFFSAPSAEQRVALADPSYKQHNPVFVKRGAVDKISDYDEFKKTFLGRSATTPAVPSGPAGNVFEIVTAECDIVTIVHKRYVQDPTMAAGTFYAAYTFDVFRIANGKLTEHWDGAQITAPATNQP
jgi:predicted SnoaL-like aldol condensation-catalyzing enzyme